MLAQFVQIHMLRFANTSRHFASATQLVAAAALLIICVAWRGSLVVDCWSTPPSFSHCSEGGFASCGYAIYNKASSQQRFRRNRAVAMKAARQYSAQDRAMLRDMLHEGFSGVTLGGFPGGPYLALRFLVEAAVTAYDLQIPPAKFLRITGNESSLPSTMSADVHHLEHWLGLIYCTLDAINRGRFFDASQFNRADDKHLRRIVEHVLQQPAPWSVAEKSKLHRAFVGRHAVPADLVSLPQLTVLVATMSAQLPVDANVR